MWAGVVEGMAMAEAGYRMADGTVVRFEFDPGDEGFQPASGDGIVGELEPAVAPLIAGARLVMEKVRAMGPAKVEVAFGVKVNGSMNWLVAKAATEANFSITLTWDTGLAGDLGGDTGR